MGWVKGIVLASFSVMVGSAPVVAQDASAPLTPLPLFTQVCTAGGGHLPKDMVRPVAYAQLPDPVRQALAFDGPNPRLGPYQAIGQGDVPNRLMRIGAATYLVLPAPGQHGAMANSCAVVWKGRDFASARSAIFALAGVKSPPTDVDFSPVKDAHIAQVSAPDFNLYATEISGWTVLREAPSTTPQSNPSPVSNSGI